ncbi:hypothetical protein Deipr_2365 (plasmid) [Deinococcus proteolyticus MRP]|uniref:Uncharacterized protein n=1 Tax=Deinococcus proteolyticus (strain ATCC 35074 / DSM 20540 / JCM 6276 / NBRC 101906 / NCIMB 13154 / VKM Ac-1939 / CCM 2703 / MRP) TaxID=693977 RepID=F0RQD0_DEIPM|nr:MULTISPECIES: hypothetical protein [Deinococcus]ADY27489.1 hypothetical protein Deipr_2365 [Deinococcus proteolyticus MRP]MCY1704008.1 hypothetical protein [Deinococcus sp. SL84]
MNTLDILSRKVREAYSPDAAFICVSTLHGYSLSVLDAGMHIIPLPDRTSFETIDHLIDLATFEFGPGLSELSAPSTQPEPVDLSELFGAASPQAADQAAERVA